MKHVRALLATAVTSALIGAGSAAVVFTFESHPATFASNAVAAAGEDDQTRIVEAVRHVEPSVVALQVTVNGTQIVPRDPFSQFFGQQFGGGFGGGFGGERMVPFQARASGSGFVYSRSGLIITNDHVVHNASKIEVVFANGDKVPGTIYSEDPSADLALVKVNDYAKLPPPVQMGNSAEVEKGEFAIAIGEPLELQQTVTLGVVSGFNRSETVGGEDVGSRQFKDLLQTSAPINPGNSGGPLINIDGQVIGVNQSVAQPAQDIGFAIPVDSVKKTVAVLESHPGMKGSMEAGLTPGQGFIGVQLAPLDSDVRNSLGYNGNGVPIAGVMGGSPADKAGLQPGDVIERVDGKPVTTPAEVADAVHKVGPGKTVSLDVWSNGNRKLVPVQVAQVPQAAD